MSWVGRVKCGDISRLEDVFSPHSVNKIRAKKTWAGVSF